MRANSTANFLSLFGSTFLLFAGYGLFLNSASLYLVEQGVSSFHIGLLNASFFGGGLISSITAHRIVSRVGHIRSFAVFSSIFAATSLVHTMVYGLWAWFILRVILGYCYCSLLMVVESWFTERSLPEKRAKVLGIYNGVYYVSVIFGALLLSVHMPIQQIFSLAAIVIILALVPVSLTRIPSPEVPPPQRISIPRIFSIAPLATAGSFAAGIMVNGFFSMASVFMSRQNYSVAELSLYFSIAMVGGFLSQYPIATLSNRYGRRNAILMTCSLAMVISAIILIVMWFWPHWLWSQYVTAFILGVSLFTLYALSLARANDILPNNMSTVEVSRTILFSYTFGSLCAPVILGAVMEILPVYGFYMIYLLVSTLMVVFAISQSSVPEELRSVHVNVPGQMSHVMSEIDPRNEQHDIPFNSDVAQSYVEQVVQSQQSEDGVPVVENQQNEGKPEG